VEGSRRIRGAGAAARRGGAVNLSFTDLPQILAIGNPAGRPPMASMAQRNATAIEATEFGQPYWPRRRRFLFIMGSATSLWAVSILVAYGLIRLF
jgi:hypothetical protein